MTLVLLGLLFICSSQPLVMVISMITLTLFYSFYIYTVYGTMWYSFMVMLVMLSGVLVIFTYMISLTPNERFEMIGLVCGAILIFVYEFCEFFVFLWWMDDGFKLWGNCIWVMNVFLIVFLLVVMIMVVWLTLFNKWPLRISY